MSSPAAMPHEVSVSMDAVAAVAPRRASAASGPVRFEVRGAHAVSGADRVVGPAPAPAPAPSPAPTASARGRPRVVPAFAIGIRQAASAGWDTAVGNEGGSHSGVDALEADRIRTLVSKCYERAAE